MDLWLAGLVLQFPHPLLSDHVNFDSICRRFVLLEINLRAPAKHRHGDEEGDDGPESLELVRTGDGTWNLVRRPASITNHEKDQHCRDERRKEECDTRKIEVECVNLP